MKEIQHFLELCGTDIRNIDILDRLATGRLGEQTYLYRVVPEYVEKGSKAIIDFETLKVGDPITDAAYQSTAFNTDKLGLYDNMYRSVFPPRNRPIYIVYNAPAETRGFAPYIFQKNIIYGENEFVLPRGTQAKVNHIDRKNGVVYADILPESQDNPPPIPWHLLDDIA
jgi:hypothetical protein